MKETHAETKRVHPLSSICTVEPLEQKVWTVHVKRDDCIVTDAELKQATFDTDAQNDLASFDGVHNCVLK